MASVLVPFVVYFIGDGSAVNFTLDTERDPFLVGRAGNISDSTPLQYSFNPGRSGLLPSAVKSLGAKDSFGSLGTPTASITQSQITFTLSSAPSNGDIFEVNGYIQF